jgi:N-acetylglucosamine-6-phosphate deacetylase
MKNGQLTAILPDAIFTGEQWLKNHAVILQDTKVSDVVPVGELNDPVIVERKAGVLVPAFIDLQIYGAYGKLLAVYPETDALVKLNDYCRTGGAVYCMPTVATNTYEIFRNSIDAIRKYWDEGGKGVLGIHLEGPWINQAKKGAHIGSLIHSPTLEQVKELLVYGKGVIKMITLAPEICSPEVIEYILSEGIVISAGHSNATYDEAIAGFSKGIKAVTHLYNAMSPLQHRAPGLVGAAMDDQRAMSSIIPDGHHVDFAAIRIARRAMGDRLFVITDAVTETQTGAYPHTLAGDKYESEGILSGSALTMLKSVQNLVNHCGIEPGEAIRMCSLYPARVIGMDQNFGKIEKGYDVKMLLLNESNELLEIIER